MLYLCRVKQIKLKGMTKLERLKNVMSVQSVSRDTKRMNKFILTELKNIKGVTYYESKGNIYATKGESKYYPCIVSHTDTVHDIIKDFRVVVVDDKMIALNYSNGKRVGIGGDDKVGIFLALELMRDLDVCKVAFFKDEEIGCVGSSAADMNFFNDVGYMFQADRRGNRDFICDIYGVELYSIEFLDKIVDNLLDFKKEEEYGALTDVYQLVLNGYTGSVANISCGYYLPHTDDEYIVISEVYQTIDFVKECIKSLGNEFYEVVREYKNTKKNNYSYYDYGNFSNWSVSSSNKNNKKKKKSDLKPDKEVYCSQCYSEDSLCYDEFDSMYYCYNCMCYVNVKEIE